MGMRKISLRREIWMRRLGLGLALGACLYFGYFLVFGQNGTIALKRLEAELARDTQEYNTKKAEVERLKARVRALRSDENPDPDLLEEMARERLVYGYEGEVILLRNSGGDGGSR